MGFFEQARKLLAFLKPSLSTVGNKDQQLHEIRVKTNGKNKIAKFATARTVKFVLDLLLSAFFFIIFYRENKSQQHQIQI